MSKTPYPYRNGTRVSPVARWLCDQVNGVDPDNLTKAVDTMRTRFGEVCTTKFGEPLVARLRTTSE
jgi:hypothetical protein